MTTNYSFYAIPAVWIISLYPHIYASNQLKKVDGSLWSNQNPRSTILKPLQEKSVSAECYARYERAEASHLNGMENAPFFIGAVLAGNMVGLSARTMNTVAGVYVGLRVAYTALYINTTTQKWSYLRSLVWGTSVGMLMWVYVRAGKRWTGRY